MRVAPILLLTAVASVYPPTRAVTAQTSTQPAPPVAAAPALNAAKIFDSTGCVSAVSEYPARITFSDQHHNVVYRLTGNGLEGYVGHRVHVVGGLVPNATTAAQAGGLDAASMVRKTTIPNEVGRGWQLLPEMRVKRVETVPGSCPEH